MLADIGCVFFVFFCFGLARYWVADFFPPHWASASQLASGSLQKNQIEKLLRSHKCHGTFFHKLEHSTNQLYEHHS